MILTYCTISSNASVCNTPAENINSGLGRIYHSRHSDTLFKSDTCQKTQHILTKSSTFGFFFRNNDTSQQNRHGPLRRPANQARSIVSRCDAVLSPSSPPATSSMLTNAQTACCGVGRRTGEACGCETRHGQQSGSVAGTSPSCISASLS